MTANVGQGIRAEQERTDGGLDKNAILVRMRPASSSRPLVGSVMTCREHAQQHVCISELPLCDACDTARSLQVIPRTFRITRKCNAVVPSPHGTHRDNTSSVAAKQPG